MGKKEMQVSAIENGTVIDHIPAEKTYEVVDLLGLRNSFLLLLVITSHRRRLGRRELSR